MLRLPIKKMLAGAAVATILFMVQTSPHALAATDDTAAAAAQTGVGYLAANQSADGSVSGFGGTTDWAAIAVQADGQQAADFSNGGTSALDFMQTDAPGPATAATDVERKIIAVAAIGQDTSNFGGVDYDTTLAGYHVGQQIGDPTLLNDDIFGVIAAAAAKDPALHDTAQDGLDYFLAHQAADGGFSYTTDTCAFCGSDSNDTAAAIIAMQAASSMGLSNANLVSGEAKALAYLLSTQQPEGGFAYDVFSPSDGSSTAWSLMALNSVGNSVRAQALLARDWLLADQNPDGGFSYGAFGVTASDTSTTAHAIVALLGTTWLLQPSPIHASPQPVVTGSTPADATNTNTNTSAAAPTATTASSSTAAAAGMGNPEVLGAQTTAQETDKPAGILKAKPKRSGSASLDKSRTSYSVYAAVVLAFIALTWYVLQSRRKPEGA